MVNVMGSPGGGKTTLIKHLIEDLRSEYNIGVIEADIAGKIDAIKIADMGIPVVQLNTDGACHIEAMSIKNILPDFDLDKLDLIFIENIGNLVCPAEFNIGEDIKLAILSVPEGDDKVEKYPLMFTNSEALVINKFDMKPYFDFDDKRVEEKSRKLNPDINLFRISAKNGDGIGELVSYLKNKINSKKND
jgi:hydrogenase nickel incorporation protein HypB